MYPNLSPNSRNCSVFFSLSLLIIFVCHSNESIFQQGLNYTIICMNMYSYNCCFAVVLSFPLSYVLQYHSDSVYRLTIYMATKSG